MGRSKAKVTFALAVAMVAASAILIFRAGTGSAEQAPSLTVVATLSAFVIALSFRQLGSSRVEVRQTAADRRLLMAALALAASTLFVDVRIVSGTSPHVFSRALHRLIDRLSPSHSDPSVRQ